MLQCLRRSLFGTVIVSSEFPETVTVSCAFHEQPVMCPGADSVAFAGFRYGAGWFWSLCPTVFSISTVPFGISDASTPIFTPRASLLVHHFGKGSKVKWSESNVKSIRIDARGEKTGAHASTLKFELMHGVKKQGGMHHFPAERLGIHNNRPLCAGCSRHSNLKKRGIL